MLDNMMPIEGEDQIHKTGQVYKKSSHVVPVGDDYFPWHQGRRAEWQKDNYAEYVHYGKSWSKFSRQAHRIKVNIQTEFTNSRRYHDWKGYDDIEPVAYTAVFFNDRQVGSIRGWANDILRHLLKVHSYIEELQSSGFGGWWSEEDLQKEVGRQVDYDGYPGVIADVLGYVRDGEILIYSPTWPDDGYDRGGKLRTSILYEKINWYPKSEEEGRARVEIPDPLWG